MFDVFSEAATRDQDFTFSTLCEDTEEEFILHAFLLPKEFSDDEKGNNAVFYGAHGRSVERIELDGALGMKKIAGNFVYFGYVESNYQDGIANQERTYLVWPSGLFDTVHREVIDHSKVFLSEEIEKIRMKQSQVVESLRNEHLRFLSVVDDPDQFAEKLSLSTQSTEDIYIEMSRSSLRQYTRRKNSFNEAKRKSLPDFDERAKEYAKELKSESLSSLAEYVLKRKLVLEVFEERLKFKNVDSEESYFEEAVHEIICPLRESTDTLDYDDHNLWIVDDSLAFYTYFNSDKTISSITGGADSSRKEPDLALFDLGLGFEHHGSSEPITIIEFKKPKRNDYNLQHNPFVQVRSYVSKLRGAGIAVAADGTEIRHIEENTPFACFVIADITPTLQSMMEQFGPFHRKAGHGAFYKWDESFKIFIEVTSYSEVLKGAKARHQAFFDRLGVAQ